MKKIIQFVIVFLLLGLPFAFNIQGQNKLLENISENYHPRYWLEGTFDHAQIEDVTSEQMIKSKIDEAYSKGWRGITVWGADRDGAKMNYYFKSPFL